MGPRESEVNPFLQGNFAPWRVEGVGENLEVEGRIPAELTGTFLRNGPNPAFEPRGPYHWFDGDGMIHAITLRDGVAHYRGRYILSHGLCQERDAGRSLYGGLLTLGSNAVPGLKHPANANIIGHAGRLLALSDFGMPTRVRPGTLDTLGEYDFGGRLPGPISAHPKIDPETNEMHALG